MTKHHEEAQITIQIKEAELENTENSSVQDDVVEAQLMEDENYIVDGDSDSEDESETEIGSGEEKPKILQLEIEADRKWSEDRQVLFLHAFGFTKKEIADGLKVHHQTIARVLADKKRVQAVFRELFRELSAYEDLVEVLSKGVNTVVEYAEKIGDFNENLEELNATAKSLLDQQRNFNEHTAQMMADLRGEFEESIEPLGRIKKEAQNLQEQLKGDFKLPTTSAKMITRQMLIDLGQDVCKILDKQAVAPLVRCELDRYLKQQEEKQDKLAEKISGFTPEEFAESLVLAIFRLCEKAEMDEAKIIENAKTGKNSKLGSFINLFTKK